MSVSNCTYTTQLRLGRIRSSFPTGMQQKVRVKDASVILPKFHTHYASFKRYDNNCYA